ncbi:MAG: hypothetical protein ABR526_00675, partial [Chthoniobacterales bacterium]
IGPSTKLNGALQDPVLELHDSTGATIATNDNWKTDDLTRQSQQAEIEGSTIPPTDDRESALIRTLTPGNYTAILRGKNDTTGLAVVEAYDLDPFANSKLANISTRGFIGTGDNVLIGGFLAGPQNAGSTRVVIRAIGPSLRDAGVANAMADPTLELRNRDGVKVAENDNWRDQQAAEIQATGLAPRNDNEAALLIPELGPAAYTAIVAGKNGNTGVGLVEVYNLQ